MNSRMTIGIDASRAFVQRKTGTETYGYQLIHALATADCKHRLRLYVKPGSQPNSFGLPIVTIDWPKLWTQGGLALETWRDPPNLLFVPAHVIPFFKNPRVPAVVTVHDLRTEFLPQHESLLQRLYLNRWAEWLRGKLATQIIAVSAGTKGA